MPRPPGPGIRAAASPKATCTQNSPSSAPEASLRTAEEPTRSARRVFSLGRLLLTVTDSAYPAWWPWNDSWDEHRPCPCATCAFRASTCGICAGRTPGTARTGVCDLVRHPESALRRAPRSAARTVRHTGDSRGPARQSRKQMIMAFTVIPASACVLVAPGARLVIGGVYRARRAGLLPVRAARLFASGPPRRKGGQPEGGWTAQVVGGHVSGPGAGTGGGHWFLRLVPGVPTIEVRAKVRRPAWDQSPMSRGPFPR